MMSRGQETDHVRTLSLVQIFWPFLLLRVPIQFPGIRINSVVRIPASWVEQKTISKLKILGVPPVTDARRWPGGTDRQLPWRHGTTYTGRKLAEYMIHLSASPDAWQLFWRQLVPSIFHAQPELPQELMVWDWTMAQSAIHTAPLGDVIDWLTTLTADLGLAFAQVSSP